MNAPALQFANQFQHGGALFAVPDEPSELDRLLQRPQVSLLDDGHFDKIMRIAEVMASGRCTVPEHLAGNVGDCAAVVTQALQWRFNPWAVAQKTHIISGKLGYEAQLVAAAINASGIVADRFRFDWYGPWENIIGRFVEKTSQKGNPYRVPGWTLNDEKGLGVKVSAVLRGESEPRVLDLLLLQAAVRNSTLWAEDPRQQLAYLAQKRWARLYAPDVILGVYTADELGGATPSDKEVGMPSGELAPPPPPAPPPAEPYAAKDFETNLPSWRDVIASGRKTPEALIAMVESKGRLFTEDQKTKLKACLEPTTTP